MDFPSIDHPLNTTNFTIFRWPGRITLAFSYETIIGFYHPGHLDWIVCENVWSKTTGKHLNWLEEDKKKRVGPQEFHELLKAALYKRLPTGAYV